MIKNIVFDLGNVLLTFQPEEYLQRRFSADGLRRKLREIIFQSLEWVELDRGTITQEEAVHRITARNPELAEEIKAVFNDWVGILRPIEETIEILNCLNNQGIYGLYALSNFHLVPLQVLKGFAFYNYFDGLIISAREKQIKPEPAIYQLLLDRFKLEAKETVFIDDMPENLEGARAFGIKTIQFTGPAQLREALQDLEISC